MITSSSQVRLTLLQMLCCSSSLLLVSCSDQTAETPATSAAESVVAAPAAVLDCQQLASITFTAESIGLPTTGANVVVAELVAADAADNSYG